MTESMSEALARLAARGFTRDLVADDGRLRDAGSGELHAPEHLAIAEIVRFEGESDPDEQAVVFALTSRAGRPLGAFATVFGPGMPLEDVEVVRRLGAKG